MLSREFMTQLTLALSEAANDKLNSERMEVVINGNYVKSVDITLDEDPIFPEVRITYEAAQYK